MKKQLCQSGELLVGVPIATAFAKKGCHSLRAASSFGCLLLLCFGVNVLAQGQIVCGTACDSGAIPVFTSSGTNAGIGDSLFTQSGNTITLNSGDLGLSSSSVSAGNILKGSTLFLHSFGSNNVFLGLNAGNLTMGYSANNNTAIGTNALPSLTTGCCNTAAGNNALLQNTTGGGNTAVGDGALYTNSTGGNNTAIGRWALISNTSGFQNTASGVQALQSNTSGYENTATGFQALLSNNLGLDNTATGFQALLKNTAGNNNTAHGYAALVNNTTGYWNTAVGINALTSNTTGNFNTAIGEFADVSAGNLINATAIGADAVVNASNKIRLGNTYVTVIEGQVPYTYTSDRNQKENFQPVDGEQVLNKIRGLSLTSWNYIGHDPKQFRHYGPVAQEFYAAFGHDSVGMVGNDKTINSGDLDGILMIAVQTLQKNMETLKTINAELKGRLEKLERVNSN